MTKEHKATAKRAVKYAALLGAVLALACHLVPHDYRAVCNAVAQICAGGL